MTTKKFEFMGDNYSAIKVDKFKTSFGWAGSPGVIISKAGRNFGQYKNINEFERDKREVIAISKRLKKQQAKNK